MGHLRSGAVCLSIGVLALFACSRVASQTNFIGHPCKADADCPSDLICANEGNGVQTCQNRCLAGAQCQDPSQTCINGACISGLQSGGADGGDFKNTGMPDSGGFGTDGGGSSSGGPVFVGTTIVKDVATGPSPGAGGGPGLSSDGTLLAFVGTQPGQFGGNDTVVKVLHIDTTTLETVGKYPQGSSSSVQGAAFLYNGSAFWIESNGSGQQIMKGTPGNNGVQVAISNAFQGLGGGADSTAVLADKYLYFLTNGGTPAALAAYDLTSGTLGNPTTIDNAVAKLGGGGPKSAAALVAGGSVYWLHYPGGAGMNVPIWTGAPGATGAVSGAELIPAAATSSYAGLFAGPSGRFFATSGGSGFTFYDANSAAVQRLVLAGAGFNPAQQIGTDIYTAVNGGGGMTLTKYTLPSSTGVAEQTWGQGAALPMAFTVNGNVAYWAERYSDPQMPTQYLYRFAKATIP